MSRVPSVRCDSFPSLCFYLWIVLPMVWAPNCISAFLTFFGLPQVSLCLLEMNFRFLLQVKKVFNNCFFTFVLLFSLSIFWDPDHTNVSQRSLKLSLLLILCCFCYSDWMIPIPFLRLLICSSTSSVINSL